MKFVKKKLPIFVSIKNSFIVIHILIVEVNMEYEQFSLVNRKSHLQD